jgi:TonB family protein
MKVMLGVLAGFCVVVGVVIGGSAYLALRPSVHINTLLPGQPLTISNDSRLDVEIQAEYPVSVEGQGCRVPRTANARIVCGPENVTITDLRPPLLIWGHANNVRWIVHPHLGDKHNQIVSYQATPAAERQDTEGATERSPSDSRPETQTPVSAGDNETIAAGGTSISTGPVQPIVQPDPDRSVFSQRYAWYIDAINRRMSQAWNKFEVDPRTPKGTRVYIVFPVSRSGDPGNPQLDRSSGSPTLDRSCLRAVTRVKTFGALPSGYAGSTLRVSYYCEY